MTHLGWADDSSCVRSNDELPELRFWDVSGKELDPSEPLVLQQLREKAWASSDGGCLYSRETVGVHLPQTDAEGHSHDPMVRALGSSHGTGARLLAVGDEFQQLRLLRYPCVSAPAMPPAPGAAPLAVGHAAALSAVRFSYNDRYVVSAGGEDLSVFVWRVRAAPTARTAPTAAAAESAETGETAPTAAGAGAVAGADASAMASGAVVGAKADAVEGEDGEEDEEGEDDDDDDSDVEPDERLSYELKSKGEQGGADDEDDDDDLFSLSDQTVGEQVGSIQPWRDYH